MILFIKSGDARANLHKTNGLSYSAADANFGLPKRNPSGMYLTSTF
jgi:hypothetical protein